MTTKRSSMLWSLIVVLVLASAAPFASAQQGHSPASATPEPVAGSPIGGWQVESVTAVEIDGTPVTMSPDGLWIAGLDRDLSLCIWEVATMEPTCDQSPRMPISADTIVWAPDSSAVAFALDAFLRAYESDIYMYELGASTSINLTDDGIEGGVFDYPEDGPVPVDSMPVWAPDSQSIIFTRTDVRRDERATNLMQISRAGGEPELLDTLSDSPHSVYTPMYVLSDGSVIYTLAPPQLSDPDSGIWLRTPDGEMRHLLPGGNDADYPIPVISDVHEGDGDVRIAGYSVFNLSRFGAEAPIAFTLDLDSGDVTPVKADDPGLVPWAITFSPDGETFWSGVLGPSTASLLQVSGGDQQVIELSDAEAGRLGHHDRFPSIEWRGENTLFVPSGLTRGSYIVTLAAT